MSVSGFLQSVGEGHMQGVGVPPLQAALEKPLSSRGEGVPFPRTGKASLPGTLQLSLRPPAVKAELPTTGGKELELR